MAATDIAGYHMSRAAFDRVLREHASACGASRINAHVRRVEFDGPIVVGVRIAAEGVCRCWVASCSTAQVAPGLSRDEASVVLTPVTGRWP